MISQLRSLYIPHIADHPHGANLETHEMAMQIVDIVTLRPEIELCYMGLGTKCFEILENSSTHRDSRSSGRSGRHLDDSDDEHDDSDDDDDEPLSSDDDLSEVEVEVDRFSPTASSESERSSESDSGWGFFRRKKKTPKLRLQEILFYDKISIFKARYGRL
jgi:hypothetical protein